MIRWQESDHLILDDEGIVYARPLPGDWDADPIRLGPIDDPHTSFLVPDEWYEEFDHLCSEYRGTPALDELRRGWRSLYLASQVWW